jgi:hypothetical protein
VMPSRFADRVVHLAPPTFPEDFTRPQEANLNRKGRRRFLHVVGKPAHGDRNGVMLRIYRYAVQPGAVRAADQEPGAAQAVIVGDSRIRWDSSAPDDRAELYEGLDAPILPRRYGGVCLPMNEALTSRLPVIMPNTSPNNAICRRSGWSRLAQRRPHISGADPILQRQDLGAGTEAR